MFILFTMRICGLEFSSSIIDRVGQIITNIPGLSRRALSQQVCELFNWRSRSGKLQDGNCRKALNKLHQQGVLELPRRERIEFSKAKATVGHEGTQNRTSFSLLFTVGVRRDRDSSRYKPLLQKRECLASPVG